jgi:hypothetical protein
MDKKKKTRMDDIMEGFEEYTGSYDKQFYDVIKDDTVYTQVWPNAGAWRKGGLTLCSDEERTNIKIKPSHIHPGEISMDSQMTLEEYEKTITDTEAYIEKRKPIAEEEYRQWEEEQEKERREMFADYEYIEHGDTWELRHKDYKYINHSRRPVISKEERQKLRKLKKQKRKDIKLQRRRNKRR